MFYAECVVVLVASVFLVLWNGRRMARTKKMATMKPTPLVKNEDGKRMMAAWMLFNTYAKEKK